MSTSKKEGWYPGKYVGRKKSSSDEQSPSSATQQADPAVAGHTSSEDERKVSTEKDSAKDKWYPGKLVGRKPPRRLSQTSGSSSEQNASATSFSRAFVPPSPSSSNATPAGQLLLKIVGAKHFSATRPSFEILLEHRQETFSFLGLSAEDGSYSEEFECQFPVLDIASEVVILIKEEYSVNECHYLGRVVIPISRYINADQVKVEWFQVFPLPTQPIAKYQSGLAQLPGSALVKSKECLGFMGIQVAFHRATETVAELYTSGDIVRTIEPLSDFDVEQFCRLYFRLKALLQPPAFVAPVLKFPEVFILIGIWAFLCFGLREWHVPYLLLGILMLNGVLSAATFEPTIFNDMNVVSLAKQHQRDPNFAYYTLRPTLFMFQQDLAQFVSFCECLNNLCSFADPQLSKLFFTAVFVICTVAALLAAIFSLRLVIFLVGAVLLFINSLRDIFPEFFSRDLQSDRKIVFPVGANLESVKQVLVAVVTCAGSCRVGTQMQIVENDGIEMQDASTGKTM